MQEVGPLESGTSRFWGFELRKFRGRPPALGTGCLVGQTSSSQGSDATLPLWGQGSDLAARGECLEGAVPGAAELGVQGWGTELRGRASPAEGGSGRRGVRARRWKRRPGGGPAVVERVERPLGLVSPGGEGGRWGGPVSAVGEWSGRASLAREGVGWTGVTGGEESGRGEGPPPARWSGRAPAEVKRSSG